MTSCFARAGFLDRDAVLVISSNGIVLWSYTQESLLFSLKYHFSQGQKFRKVYLLSGWGSWASSVQSQPENNLFSESVTVFINYIFLSHMSFCAYCWVCKSCLGRSGH